MKKKTSLFENGLIWFGAGVSLAEILTGTYFASLALEKVFLPLSSDILLAVPCFPRRSNWRKTRRSAMETVK